jgi:hypothetical protein
VLTLQTPQDITFRQKPIATNNITRAAFHRSGSGLRPEGVGNLLAVTLLLDGVQSKNGSKSVDRKAELDGQPNESFTNVGAMHMSAQHLFKGLVMPTAHPKKS